MRDIKRKAFSFHDQSNSIHQQVAKLEESIKNSGFDIEYIHTGPVIRREDVFEGLIIDERRKLLYKIHGTFPCSHHLGHHGFGSANVVMVFAPKKKMNHGNGVTFGRGRTSWELFRLIE